MTNSGEGIPSDRIETIFDRYERIMSERTEGTGLGLPIVRELVRLHGGKVWVESQSGKSTTFFVTLPITQ